MADANYGLLFQTPQFQPAPQAAGVLAGMQQAQTMAINKQNADTQRMQATNQGNLVNSQVKQVAQQMSLQDLSTTSNIFGSVALNPNPASYQQALMMAHKAGLDISDAPTTWGADAQSFVNNAAVMSKQALEWKQAQAQLAMTQAQLNNASADVNIKAQQSGLNTPFPNAPGGSNYNSNSQPSNLISPNGQPPTAQMDAGNGTQASQPMTFNTPVGTINVGGGNPQIPSANIGGPAGLAGNKTNLEEQAKNWQTLLDKSQSGASQYDYTNAILNQAAEAVDKGLPGGPGIGMVKALTPSGQLLDKNAAIIQQNLIKQLAAGGGIGRIMQSEIGIITKSTPENTKYGEVNHKIIDNLKATNAVTNGLQPRLLMKLNSMGIRDPNIAGNVMDEILTRAEIFDPKTGDVTNHASLSKLTDTMDSVLKDFQQGKLFNGENSKTEPSNFNTSDTFIAPNGVAGTYDQLQEAAKAKGMSVDQFIQTHDLKKKSVDSSQQASSTVNLQDLPGYKIAQSVSPMESGGNYKALGQVQKNGDRALGKYQVMASNVPKWTKEILGQSLSPKEFLNNPVAQDVVASVKLHQYYQQYGNPSDAVSMWFSGKPFKGNNRRDSIGTSTPQYVNAALKELSKYASL